MGVHSSQVFPDYVDPDPPQADSDQSPPAARGPISESAWGGATAGAVAGMVWMILAPTFYIALESVHSESMDWSESWPILMIGLLYFPIGPLYGVLLGTIVGTVVGVAYKLAGRIAAIATGPVIPVALMALSYESWDLILDTSNGWSAQTQGEAQFLMLVLGPVLAVLVLIGRHVNALHAKFPR